MGNNMVRVDRGDGKLFQFQQKDVAAFMSANPGAKVLGPKVQADTITDAEVAATEAQEAKDPKPVSMPVKAEAKK